MAYVIQCEAHAELSSSLGLREEPLSRHGEDTNTLWYFLVGAEPSLISRGRCANNLQCSSSARGLCSNVTAMGPQGPFLDTRGYTWCPAIPQKREGVPIP